MIRIHPQYSTALLDTDTGRIIWPVDHCPFQKEDYDTRLRKQHARPFTP